MQRPKSTEPHSIHPDAVRQFAAVEPQPQRPPPDTVSIVLASSMILAILLLAIPAIVGIVRPATSPALTTTAPAPATIPTAIVATNSPALAATDSPSGPTAGLSLLPATVPAGVTPDDRMFTVYAGWPYQLTGESMGDSCGIQIWPNGQGPSDQLWIDCHLVEGQ